MYIIATWKNAYTGRFSLCLFSCTGFITHNSAFRLAFHAAPFLQVIIKKRKTTQNLLEDRPRCGEFVLCFLDKYVDEFPQLAKVLEVKSEQLFVHWFKGAKTTVWHPKTLTGKGQRKPFTEWISKNDAFFHSFHLTANGSLPKVAKDAVDKFMEEL